MLLSLSNMLEKVGEGVVMAVSKAAGDLSLEELEEKVCPTYRVMIIPATTLSVELSAWFATHNVHRADSQVIVVRLDISGSYTNLYIHQVHIKDGL